MGTSPRHDCSLYPVQFNLGNNSISDMGYGTCEGAGIYRALNKVCFARLCTAERRGGW